LLSHFAPNMRRLWAAASSLNERSIFLPNGYSQRARRGKLKIAAARVGVLERSRRRRRRRRRRRQLSGDPY